MYIHICVCYLFFLIYMYLCVSMCKYEDVNAGGLGGKRHLFGTIVTRTWGSPDDVTHMGWPWHPD